MSFAQDCLAHEGNLMRYAKSLMRGDPDKIRDLVQDTFVKALEKQHLYREIEGSGLRQWLFCLMHNIYVNHVRRTARETKGREEGIVLADVMGRGESRDLVSRESQELTLRTKEIVGYISERLTRDKARVVCAIADGATYHAVARAEKVPTGTVRSRLSRARSELTEWAEERMVSYAVREEKQQRQDKIRELWYSNLDINQIAQRCGVARTTIEKDRREMKLPIRRAGRKGKVVLVNGGKTGTPSWRLEMQGPKHIPAQAPVAEGGFIKPPTLAQLMGRK